MSAWQARAKRDRAGYVGQSIGSGVALVLLAVLWLGWNATTVHLVVLVVAAVVGLRLAKLTVIEWE